VEGVAGPNVFRREGEFWTVSYQGVVFRLRDSKGLRLLAHLLAHPQKEFHVLDLVAEVEGTAAPAPAAASSDRLGEPSDDVGPILDERAKIEYRTRLTDLAEELEEAERWADPERASKARQEIDALT